MWDLEEHPVYILDLGVSEPRKSERLVKQAVNDSPLSELKIAACAAPQAQLPRSGQREEKNPVGGLVDSSSESGDDVKRHTVNQSQQQSHQPSSCAVQQQQQQQQQQHQSRVVEHQQSPGMYQLPTPVSVSSPHSYHQNHTGATLNHSHTPTHHMQQHDTSSESGDDKRNLHHQLQHLQASHSGGHGIVHPAATLPPPPTTCTQQKSQLDYMQYYSPQDYLIGTPTPSDIQKSLPHTATSMQMGAIAPSMSSLGPMGPSTILPSTVQSVNGMNAMSMNVGMGVGAYQGMSSMGMATSHTGYHSGIVLGDYHSL
ncbi:hypothetical protein PV326_002127 [Microctonus aethiopoides]|nr:hypothetical protein PV326_002127 [Microctonus aethiopoides]